MRLKCSYDIAPKGRCYRHLLLRIQQFRPYFSLKKLCFYFLKISNEQER